MYICMWQYKQYSAVLTVVGSNLSRGMAICPNFSFCPLLSTDAKAAWRYIPPNKQTNKKLRCHLRNEIRVRRMSTSVGTFSHSTVLSTAGQCRGSLITRVVLALADYRLGWGPRRGHTMDFCCKWQRVLWKLKYLRVGHSHSVVWDQDLCDLWWGKSLWRNHRDSKEWVGRWGVRKMQSIS